MTGQFTFNEIVFQKSYYLIYFLVRLNQIGKDTFTQCSSFLWPSWSPFSIHKHSTVNTLSASEFERVWYLPFTESPYAYPMGRVKKWRVQTTEYRQRLSSFKLNLLNNGDTNDRFWPRQGFPNFSKSAHVTTQTNFGAQRVVPELEILTIFPDLTLNFVTQIGWPQCNGSYCWQASLFHLPPKFTRTVKKCGNGKGVRELY